MGLVDLYLNIENAEKAKEEMGKITEGMGLPKDMNLPF